MSRIVRAMGNPFVHIELAADDVGGAKKFYKAVFDWKLEDMPGMDYTMLDVGKGTGGGMTAKQMPGQPTTWLPYVAVASVDATLGKAEKAGAKILLPRHPIGEMGAIGVFMDPQGGALGVWEMAAKAAPKKKAAAKKKAAPKKAAKKKGKR
jgi:hypothetical protein